MFNCSAALLIVSVCVAAPTCKVTFTFTGRLD
jgi:hypothetical protein